MLCGALWFVANWMHTYNVATVCVYMCVYICTVCICVLMHVRTCCVCVCSREILYYILQIDIYTHVIVRYSSIE